MRGGDQRSGALFSYVDLELRRARPDLALDVIGSVGEGLAAPAGTCSLI
jgi:hypothetical protein